jgi:hypothetical protein
MANIGMVSVRYYLNMRKLTLQSERGSPRRCQPDHCRVLTPCNSVMYIQASDSHFSIVFVHGLNGDRLATWTKDKICWPRDLLKVDMPNSRIMSVSIKLLNMQRRNFDI